MNKAGVKSRLHRAEVSKRPDRLIIAGGAALAGSRFRRGTAMGFVVVQPPHVVFGWHRAARVDTGGQVHGRPADLVTLIAVQTIRIRPHGSLASGGGLEAANQGPSASAWSSCSFPVASCRSATVCRAVVREASTSAVRAHLVRETGSPGAGPGTGEQRQDRERGPAATESARSDSPDCPQYIAEPPQQALTVLRRTPKHRGCRTPGTAGGHGCGNLCVKGALSRVDAGSTRSLEGVGARDRSAGTHELRPRRWDRNAGSWCP